MVSSDILIATRIHYETEAERILHYLPKTKKRRLDKNVSFI